MGLEKKNIKKFKALEIREKLKRQKFEKQKETFLLITSSSNNTPPFNTSFSFNTSTETVEISQRN